GGGGPGPRPLPIPPPPNPCAVARTYDVPQGTQDPREGLLVTKIDVSQKGPINGVGIALLKDLNTPQAFIPSLNILQFTFTGSTMGLTVQVNPGQITLQPNSFFRAGLNYFEFNGGKFTRVSGNIEAGGIPIPWSSQYLLDKLN